MIKKNYLITIAINEIFDILSDQIFSLNKVHETLCQMIQFISRHDKRSIYWFIDT